VTRITLFWGEEGLVGLEARGHSGGGFKGEDVVCAAVSALVQALLVGLRDVAGASEAECERDSSDSLIRVRWPKIRASEFDLLTRTIALSLMEVASRYAEFVSIAEVHES
jgi:uncharacterized protein YsxB (DUF464 family)